MTDYLVTDAELTAIADAIREKGGTSEALEWPDGFVDAIGAIGGGGGTKYNITNNVPSIITLDKSSAEEGETVTATLGSGYPSGGHSYYAQWSSNYVLLFTVNSGKGSNVPGDVATFTMPAANVQIMRGA